MCVSFVLITITHLTPLHCDFQYEFQYSSSRSIETTRCILIYSNTPSINIHTINVATPSASASLAAPVVSLCSLVQVVVSVSYIITSGIVKIDYILLLSHDISVTRFEFPL